MLYRSKLILLFINLYFITTRIFASEIITKEQILELPSQSLYYVLEQISGIYVKYYGEPGQRIEISSSVFPDLPIPIYVDRIYRGVGSLAHLEEINIENIDSIVFHSNEQRLDIFTIQKQKEELFSQVNYQDAFHNFRNLNIGLWQRADKTTSYNILINVREYKTKIEKNDNFAFPYENYNISFGIHSKIFSFCHIRNLLNYNHDHYYDYSADSTNFNKKRLEYSTFFDFETNKILDQNQLFLSAKVEYAKNSNYQKYAHNDFGINWTGERQVSDHIKIFANTEFEYNNYIRIANNYLSKINTSLIYHQNVLNLNIKLSGQVDHLAGKKGLINTSFEYSPYENATFGLFSNFEKGSQGSFIYKYNKFQKINKQSLNYGIANNFKQKFYSSNFNVDTKFEQFYTTKYLSSELPPQKTFPKIINSLSINSTFSSLHWQLGNKIALLSSKKNLYHQPTANIISNISWKDKYIHDKMNVRLSIYHKYMQYRTSKKLFKANLGGIEFAISFLDLEFYYGINNIFKDKYFWKQDESVIIDQNLNDYYPHQKIADYPVSGWDEIWGIRWKFYN